MPDETYYSVLTAKSWHGNEAEIISRDTPIEDGCEKARLNEVQWKLRPVYIEVSPGVFVPFGKKKGLVRLPNSWDNSYHVLDNRVVRDYEVVNNNVLIDVAKKIANETGWTFEGAGSLKKGEISFIQLRLTNDLIVAGRPYEAHRAKFMVGDDKRGGAGFGGMVFTRIVCANTWRAAISEGGVFKISHVQDPLALWKFATAQINAAVKAYREQGATLDQFFHTSIGRRQFQEFLEETVQTPGVPKAVARALEAKDLISSGQATGDELAKILFKGETAMQDHQRELALVERRRETIERGYDVHNSQYADSSETLYAAFQGLTWAANHGPSDVFRGDATTGLLFNGTRGKVVERGYNVLKEMV